MKIGRISNWGCGVSNPLPSSYAPPPPHLKEFSCPAVAERGLLSCSHLGSGLVRHGRSPEGMAAPDPFGEVVPSGKDPLGGVAPREKIRAGVTPLTGTYETASHQENSKGRRAFTIRLSSAPLDFNNSQSRYLPGTSMATKRVVLSGAFTRSNKASPAFFRLRICSNWLADETG